MDTKKEIHDSEDISTDNYPDDITSIADAIGFKKFKISFFLFVLFILISSDVFVDRILSGNSDYVEGRHATGKGTLVQGILLALGYIIISCLVSCDYI